MYIFNIQEAEVYTPKLEREIGPFEIYSTIYRCSRARSRQVAGTWLLMHIIRRRDEIDAQLKSYARVNFRFD